MIFLRILLIMLALTITARAQVDNPQHVTVANLPAASVAQGSIYKVIDGLNPTDCTIGGGSILLTCQSNGSTWFKVVSVTSAMVDNTIATISGGSIQGGSIPLSLLPTGIPNSNLQFPFVTIKGTPNQTIISQPLGSPPPPFGTPLPPLGSILIPLGGSFKISLPQDIATSSSPTFNNLTVTTSETVLNLTVTGSCSGCGGGGGGTVTTFSSGNLSPLFTTSVSNPTTTPALSFTLVNQNANLVYAGPSTGGAAAPSFRSLVVADLPTGIPNANLLNSTITLNSGGGFGIAAPGSMSLGNTYTIGSLADQLSFASANVSVGFQINGSAPRGHFLRGNGISYIDSAILSSDLPGSVLTNGTLTFVPTNGLSVNAGLSNTQLPLGSPSPPLGGKVVAIGGTVNLSLSPASSPTLTGLTLSGLSNGGVLFANSSGLISQDTSNLIWDQTNIGLALGNTSIVSGSRLSIVKSNSSTTVDADTTGLLNIRNSNVTANVVYGIIFGANNTTPRTAAIYAVGLYTSNGNSVLGFATRNTSGSLIEGLRVTDSQAVYAGVTTPSSNIPNTSIFDSATAASGNTNPINLDHIAGFGSGDENRLTWSQANIIVGQLSNYFDGTGWGLKYYTYNSGLNATPAFTIDHNPITTFNFPANKLGQNSITSASAGINNTETVIVKSTGAIGANRLLAGTVIKVTVTGTCTATVANTSTFNIRIGTAGTTADTLVFTAVTAASAAAGSSIPFRAVLEMTVRTTGASATAQGYLTLWNQGTTGIATTTVQVIKATMAAFSTTANNFIDFSYVTAAATTTSTFDQATIEVSYQ